MYQTEGKAEFVFVPFVDPITHKPVVEIGYHAYANVFVGCNLFNGSPFCKMEKELISLLYDLREFSFAPLHEQREVLLSEVADDREQILDCLRKIARVDTENFGDGREVFEPGRDVKRYTKVFFTALLAVKPIRQFEKRLYNLDEFNYGIHFDVVNREVIISNLPRIESWRKAIHIGEVNFTH